MLLCGSGTRSALIGGSGMSPFCTLRPGFAVVNAMATLPITLVTGGQGTWGRAAVIGLQLQELERFAGERPRFRRRQTPSACAQRGYTKRSVRAEIFS